ncbi:MAG: formyl transferase [Rhizobiaceae bacterium]|nr:formyl transferase [Rhizobiaceae bacterium]
MSQRAVPAPVVVVTEGGPHIWAIVNALNDAVGPVTVIQEEPEPKSVLIKRRMRLQGVVSATGQLATMVLTRLGKKAQASRAGAIAAQNALETVPRPGQAIVHVPNANAKEALEAVSRLAPKIVLLAGCRMLSRGTLAAMPCPVVNYHAGITPQYRGMNGGYWALATGDAGNFGGTVHLVDAGVDTGAVLYQQRGKPERGDNLGLYALRLASICRGICVQAVRDGLAGELKPQPASILPSRQWYHPPIWTYLWNGLFKGVW